MKKQIVVIIMMCCMVSLAGAGYVGTVLFSDSFDRPNNTDIDASSAGMSGTLSPMTYAESFEGSNVNTSIQIASNQLNMAFGPGMASLHLNHNFTDTAILSAGGFSISLDVVSIVTSDDIGNRYGGFGVGMTQAEAATAGDLNDDDADSTTMRGGGNNVAVADFFVDTALDNNLRIWHNGTLLNTIAVGTYVGTIKVEFYPSNFNAGSPVTAVVYFNGVQVATQIFTWDNTDANYVGISGRAPANGVVLDNLAIASFYSEKAQNPTPANSTIDVDPETLVLQWDKGNDASGNPNANIAQHYLYIAEGEPNFVGKTPITVADTADPITHNPAAIDAFDTDKIYYWRVDESVLVGPNPSGPSDGNTITGIVWQFETLKSIPIIQSQPVNQLVDAGQTATFTITVTSVSPDLHFQWYKSADNVNNTPDDDTPVGTDDDTLTISNAQISDEGYYFCAATNPAATVNSNAVALEIKRLVAWYAFENDITDSQNDYDGTPIKADPNIPFTFAGGKVNQAIILNGINEAVEIPRTIQNSMTIELWVKTAITGGTGGWFNGRGMVDGEIAGAANDFGMALCGNNLGFGIGNPDTTILSTSVINDNQWHYCVAIRDSVTGAMSIYVDGAQEAAATGPTGSKNAPTALRIGSLLTSFNYLAGQIDEVKLYNYPLAELTVASQYNAVTGEPVCVLSQRPDARFDVNGDCLVNLEDFTVFASGWLNCGYYPQSDCQ